MAKKQSSKRIVSFLFGLWRVAPVYVVFFAISQVLYAVLASTIAPIFVSKLLSGIANGTATLSGSTKLLIFYSIITFVGTTIMPRISIAAAYVAELRMSLNVHNRILKHLTDKSLGYHANKMSGGIVSNTSKLTGSIERFWDTMMFSAIPILTTLISVCIALGTMFWQYAVALAILSIAFIVVVIYSQIKISPISEEVAKKSSRMTAYFADVISNITTVKAFAMAKSELDNYSKRTKAWYKISIREMKNVVVMTGIFGTITTLMNICAFVAAIFATEYHLANIGVIYLVVSYTFNVVSELWEVSHTTRNFIRVLGDASPMIKTLDEDIEIKDPLHPKQCSIKDGEIVFKDVRFTHSGTTAPLFDKFYLTIKPGEQVGLVGRSGSGKTSLTRILLRFSDVENGEILIDNQNIAEITQDDLHRSIAYVAQEPILFHRSLRDNIAYGKPDATEEEIRHAAEQANALEFIEVLPKGFDTLVGERGIKLSGGQRQRIAIARAILKDAPILVLDEATSALDSETERLIQDALIKLMAGRTSIVIAHRLSTIAKLDKIVVLDNGTIIEQGSHSELLSENGVYANLWKRQSGGFIED